MLTETSGGWAWVSRRGRGHCDGARAGAAKLGIATDRNLAENFRTHYPRVLTWGMWVQAEIVAIEAETGG